MLKRIFRYSLIALTIALVGGSAAAQDKPAKKKSEDKAPSLAELARQAREKREASDTRARTITNADLAGLNARLSQGSFPEAPPETGEAAAAEGEDAETMDPALDDDPFAVNDAYDETLGDEVDSAALTEEQMAAWNDAFREARMNYQNAVNEALVLQLRVNNLENTYFGQSDGALQERLAADLDQTLKAINGNKQSQEQAKTALDALRSNAAAAGLNPEQIESLVGALPTTPPEIEIRTPDPDDPDEPPSD